MNIAEMNMEEIEARTAEITSEMLEASEERLAEIKIEAQEIAERKAELIEIETRTAEAEALTTGEVVGEVREIIKEEPKKEIKNMFDRTTAEYRDAFYAVLGDYATTEQRDIVVDTTNPGGGDAIAIPKSLDDKIWDNVHTAHPILADIASIHSGVAMEVTKHTAIAVRTQKKLDSADTPAQESNTFVKVVLYGYDYEKYVKLTYAEAKMSAGALEDYLAEEIAAELGEALAKDVFAQVLTDIGTGQRVTPDGSNPDLFADLKSALALAVGGGQKIVYAPADKYYQIVGAINASGGNPFNMGTVLGVQVKLDTAATKVTVLDPKMFVLNVVQDVMVESDKDITAHKVIVSGYLRAQGTMRHVKAAAYIN